MGKQDLRHHWGSRIKTDSNYFIGQAHGQALAWIVFGSVEPNGLELSATMLALLLDFFPS